MKNRRCPRCHAHYAPPARFCPRDGTPLVEVAPGPAGGAKIAKPASDDATGDTIDAASLTGAVLDGRYRVARRLGQGGMSYVYLSHELASGRAVAVKILTPRLMRDPGSLERLRREASIAMRLDHPNVCPILRVGQTGDGLLYLVMPFLAGALLSELENQRGPLSPAEGIPILVQVCHGLQHAHELQIVHRDLKPENVMLVPDGAGPGGYRAVVMDFGLAKERRAGPELMKLTATGIVLGTPEFMSPEQVRGKPLDGRSDIYALALLAFEMFTGRLPFEGKSQQEAMLARLRDEPMRLRDIRPDLPIKLDAALARALAARPEDRFSTMDDFAAALAAAGGASPSSVLRRLFGN